MKYTILGLLLAASQLLRAQPVPLPAAQQALDSILREYKVPALAAAVIGPASIRFVYGGVRRNDRPGPLRATDFLHLGSDTKGITSFLAAQLVEQGRVRWDTRLLDAVPELRGHVRPDYEAATLGTLLAHRAGVRPYDSGAEIDSLPAFTGPISQRRWQFARFVLRQRPVVPAGGLIGYSNAGYALAALLLERVSHRPWERLLARSFRRLGLRHRLGFPNRHDARQPWGHWLRTPQDSTLTALGPEIAYRIQAVLAPSGDVAMPLPDYARFVQLHLQGLLGQDNALKAATYQVLHFGQPEYAYGWGVSKVAGTGAPVSFHDGTAGTFFCHTILFPGEKRAFVVVTNAGGAAAEKACYALRRRLRKLCAAVPVP